MPILKYAVLFLVSSWSDNHDDRFLLVSDNFWGLFLLSVQTIWVLLRILHSVQASCKTCWWLHLSKLWILISGECAAFVLCWRSMSIRKNALRSQSCMICLLYQSFRWYVLSWEEVGSLAAGVSSHGVGQRHHKVSVRWFAKQSILPEQLIWRRQIVPTYMHLLFERCRLFLNVLAQLRTYKFRIGVLQGSQWTPCITIRVYVKFVANINKVVRVVLTPKFNDVDNLVEVLTCNDGSPVILDVKTSDSFGTLYQPLAKGFQLIAETGFYWRSSKYVYGIMPSLQDTVFFIQNQNPADTNSLHEEILWAC